MKDCKDCGETKPLDDFYRHPMMADGRLSSCKACRKRYARDRQAKGLRKEIDRRKFQKRMEENPEAVRAKAKRYREGHPEETRANSKRYRQKNPKTVLASTRRYRRENPEKARAHHAVSHAIRDGRLQREPCRVCGSTESHGHHEDYGKPLDVIWFCAQHHKDHHRAAQGDHFVPGESTAAP